MPVVSGPSHQEVQLSLGPRQTVVGSRLLPSPGALPHLADSFHSIWSPSCCRVSISVKRVGLGASSSSPRMSWSCSAAGDPAKRGQQGLLKGPEEAKGHKAN